ncbi:GTP 3',8-cyclase MoaA [Halonatronum saccharophilum]|uniref:GTP 3',8-cyclase MoaA n=1 Tax=Halonatronum saccharophilum TaxID=150060 RepID=UPI00048495DE|nr:GTP 3',8-cyclase MoaA [Halonatronum saccharophilum]
MNNLIDDLGRRVDYLRISVTDRCNLRCYYCMPSQGVDLTDHKEILTYEEIVKVVQASVRLGVKKVRLTGGEPLLRPEIVNLVRMLKGIGGINEVSLTTNGILLNKYGEELLSVGLDRVNISLDTLDPNKFKRITGYDQHRQVISGIEKALELGLDPVKVNVVLMKGINDDEIFDFINLTKEKPLHIRFIEFMPAGNNSAKDDDRYLSIGNLKARIRKRERLLPTKFNKGNGPAYYYQLPNALGTLGFITPISNHFCSSCNRLRLTATGQLRPCLSSDNEYGLKEILRGNKEIKELEEVFLKSIRRKPKEHQMEQGDNFFKNMSEIGG